MTDRSRRHTILGMEFVLNRMLVWYLTNIADNRVRTFMTPVRRESTGGATNRYPVPGKGMCFIYVALKCSAVQAVLSTFRLRSFVYGRPFCTERPKRPLCFQIYVRPSVRMLVSARIQVSNEVKGDIEMI